MSLASGQIALDVDFAALVLAGSGKPLCKLVQGVSQTGIAHDTATALTFTTEDIDTHGFHSTSVNVTRITPTVPGYYRFDGSAFFTSRTDYTLLIAYVRKNGTTTMVPGGRNSPTASSNFGLEESCTVMIDMNGTTDYVELMIQGRNTAVATMATAVSGGSGAAPVFTAEYLRAL